MNSHEIAILIICFKTDPNKQNEKIYNNKNRIKKKLVECLNRDDELKGSCIADIF